MTKLPHLCALLAISVATSARAGVYLAPSVKWASFAARSVEGESTPNYYGYGGALSLGYSLKQVVDLGAYGTYIPGKRKQAEFGADDATLVSYGGELAFRFGQTVYFGLRGGPSSYHLLARTDTSELGGLWTGSSAGFSIGAVAKLSKQSFFQTTLDVMQHVLTADDEANGTGERRFDSFGISLTYMFNSFDSSAIEDTIFKDFLDSAVFF